jgi:hypothetical protein
VRQVESEPERRSTVEALFRQQLWLAALAAAVILAALGLVAWVIDSGDAGRTVFRVTNDGPRAGAVVAETESSPAAMWAAIGALVAVGGVLLLLLAHMIRVARYSFGHHGKH